jgi:hypothetical protein
MRANRTLSPEWRGTELLSLAVLRKKRNMEKPLWGLEFSKKTLPPSGAFGATSFSGKEAPALRHGALKIQ